MAAFDGWRVVVGGMIAFGASVGLVSSCKAQESGRLLATAGVSQVEGVGGGGLAPWAVISGYGTRDAVGGNAHYTFAYLGDFTLQSAGASVGLYDRVELSYAHAWFDTRQAGARLGLGSGYRFGLDVAGAKVRLFGDVLYDQDSWAPQVAAGVELKSADRHGVVRALGARSTDGADFYLSATKLFLAQSLLVNAAIRATEANQFGFLGFGGDRDRGYSAQFEGVGGAAAVAAVRAGGGGADQAGQSPVRAGGDGVRCVRGVFHEQEPVGDAGVRGAGADRAAGRAERGLFVPARRILMRVAGCRAGLMLVMVLGGSWAVRAAESDGGLYARLGGQPGIARIVDGAVALFLADDRVKADFEETNIGRLKSRLAEQICHLAGGPCVYKGRPMGEAHAALHVDRARFNAVAEDLQQAMEDLGVPYWTQNRLMALLASMQRDVVTR